VTNDSAYMRRLRKETEVQSVAYHRAPKQERRTARRLGGYRTLASGSGRVKGDVRVPGVARIECKTTQKKSFSVTQDMLAKIEYAAMACDEVPAIIVEFLDETGNDGQEIAVISVKWLEHLLSLCRDRGDS
jgi:hypothetical protein